MLKIAQFYELSSMALKDQKVDEEMAQRVLEEINTKKTAFLIFIALLYLLKDLK